MSNFNMEIGARIRTLREKAGYSREKLSEMAGVSPKFLYEIENGRKGMSALSLYNIAHSLCVSADYILTGIQGPVSYSDIVGMLASLSPSQLVHVENIIREIASMTK